MTRPNEELIAVFRELVALERDRELGYSRDELHKDPKTVIEEALSVLDELDEDPDDVIFPDDQEKLDIDYTTP